MFQSLKPIVRIIKWPEFKDDTNQYIGVIEAYVKIDEIGHVMQLHFSINIERSICVINEEAQMKRVIMSHYGKIPFNDVKHLYRQYCDAILLQCRVHLIKNDEALIDAAI
ncbi:hypothetical protein A3715_10470 [Oleiphilus sp. HI0009]|nr:hypothetical protein A3715_10470 [Oleiphilus sp. HI0009]